MKNIILILLFANLMLNTFAFGTEVCKGNNPDNWNKCYGNFEYEILKDTNQSIYSYWLNGRPDGKAIIINKEINNILTVYFSTYKNGKRNGEFISIELGKNFDDGLIKKAIFEDSEKNETISYPSCWRSGQGNNPALWSNCFGQAFFADNSRYYGEFVEEGVAYIEFSSKGKIPNAIYIGEVKNTIVDGFGMLELPNGDKHFGKFKNFKLNGIGVSHYSNGEILRGIWKNFKLQK